MIISHNNSGLCNRLKSWASSLKIDSNCYVEWQETVKVRYKDMPFPSFSSLFENENKRPENRPFHRSVTYDRPDDIFNKGLDTDEGVLKCYRSPYLAVLPEDGVQRDFIKSPFSEKTIVDHQYHRTPTNLREQYSKIFSEIRFKKNFLEQAEMYLAKNLSDNQRDKLVTVHIRSFCDSPGRKERWYNLQNFIEKMRELDDDDVKFYLAVDENAIITQVQDVFRDKVIHFPKTKDPYDDMGSYESQAEAIIELLILGKGNALLATETSTYSEVAWWLGKCKPQVYKIGNIIYE